jgi:hypothetical protein
MIFGWRTGRVTKNCSLVRKTVAGLRRTVAGLKKKEKREIALMNFGGAKSSRKGMAATRIRGRVSMYAAVIGWKSPCCSTGPLASPLGPGRPKAHCRPFQVSQPFEVSSSHSKSPGVLAVPLASPPGCLKSPTAVPSLPAKSSRPFEAPPSVGGFQVRGLFQVPQPIPRSHKSPGRSSGPSPPAVPLASLQAVPSPHWSLIRKSPTAVPSPSPQPFQA